METEPVSRIPERDEDRVVAPNFVTAIVDDDLRRGRIRTVVTRFPPEPNGYLHIGHAKAICLDFGIVHDYGGRTNLRFDDTNPTTEDPEYVEAIERDVRWLGFTWEKERYASDYFQTLYDLARRLIENGDAYVDSQSEEAIREGRGTVTTPGTESPYRDRPAEESLELFARMREGAFAEGAHVLRAKIDMTAANMIMRDPVLYRIRHAHHYRTGDAWHVYPLYDFAHPLSDAIEGVTHSLCTLEFENNREIYDWLVSRLFDEPRPHQYEFARLNLDHTIVSKRKLLKLVKGGFVSGWDDPRMPTLTALRRRGVTPAAIRDFANRVGVTKANSRTDLGLLESAVRDDLNHRAPRVMAVLEPIPLTLSDLPDGHADTLDASLWPHDVPREATRPLPFGRELWIERGDVSTDPPKGWRRLAPGAAVRLRHGPIVVCEEIATDALGRPTSVRGRTVIDPEAAGVKVSGVVHWVARDGAVPAEFRLVDRLFADPDPEADGRDITEAVDPDSLRIVHGWVEPHVVAEDPGTRWQFERQGYFWRDPVDGRGERLAFTRIVTLKDSWKRRDDATARDATARDATAREAPLGRPRSARKPAGRAGDQPDPVDALGVEGRERFVRLEALGLSRADAARLAGDAEIAAWFDAARLAGPDVDPSSLANWTLNELPRSLGDATLADAALTPASFAELVALVDENKVSGRVAKDLLVELVERGGDPRAIVAERDLGRMDDADALAATVEEVLDAHPDEVAAYLDGKEGLIGFFVGHAMRATGGRADPRSVRQALVDALTARR